RMGSDCVRKTGESGITAGDGGARLELESWREKDWSVFCGREEKAVRTEADCGAACTEGEELRKGASGGLFGMDGEMEQGSGFVGIGFDEVGLNGKGDAKWFATCVEKGAAARGAREGDEASVEIGRNAIGQTAGEDYGS